MESNTVNIMLLCSSHLILLDETLFPKEFPPLLSPLGFSISLFSIFLMHFSPQATHFGKQWEMKRGHGAPNLMDLLGAFGKPELGCFPSLHLSQISERAAFKGVMSNP